MQKKRILVYLLFIFFGFLGAYLVLKNGTKATNKIVPATAIKKDSLVDVSLLKEVIDFENNNEAFISTYVFSSGKKSCQLGPLIEYSILITKMVKDIPSFQNLKKITVSFNCLFRKNNPDALYVLSIDNKKGKNIFWNSRPIVYNKSNDWTEQKLEFTIAPEFLNADNKIVVYPWNRNKKLFYIDDITVEYIGAAIYSERSANQSEKSNLFLDFETEAGFSNADNVKETTAHSGKRACDMGSGKEYGPSLNKKLKEFGSAFPKIISMSMWVYPLTDNPKTVLVASVINSKNETVFWEGKSTENEFFQKHKWTKINALFKLPVEKFNAEDVLGVSVWNKGKTDVIVDDIEIVYGEAPERKGLESRVDPISIYEKRFVPEKNRPPFQTIYFEKQEINNNNRCSITPLNKSNVIDNFSPKDAFLVGDFIRDKNNLDEIICLKEKSRGMFSYSKEKKQFIKHWENTLVSDPLWNSNTNAYSGDFNSDGKTDVLLVDKKTNIWKVLNFNGKNWVIISEGKDPKKEWISNKKITDATVINKNDTLFAGNFIPGKQTYLKLNTDWRFDLKLIEKEESGCRIIGNVDFKGYPKDYNPKYFEFIKMIPGNFLSKEETAIIIVMCNCVDADFSGRKCDQIENLPFLPNSVQLYNISPQITQIFTDKY